jgi:Rieske Fe-S protein
MSDPDPSIGESAKPTSGRRDFLKTTSTTVMAGGLIGGYGMFAAHAVKYLYPQREGEPSWQFVATLDDLPLGAALNYTAPGGAKVVIARQAEGDREDAFIALSSVCPHLGCQVHWEAVHERFFCPCHNGAFNRQGEATEGPPAKAGQQLTRFPLKVQDGLLFIDAPDNTLGPSPGETA